RKAKIPVPPATTTATTSISWMGGDRCLRRKDSREMISCAINCSWTDRLDPPCRPAGSQLGSVLPLPQGNADRHDREMPAFGRGRRNIRVVYNYYLEIAYLTLDGK